MCEVMQKYENFAVHKERIEKIQAMLREDCTKEFILKIGYTKEEYTEAEAELFQMA